MIYMMTKFEYITVQFNREHLLYILYIVAYDRKYYISIQRCTNRSINFICHTSPKPQLDKWRTLNFS